MHRLLRDVGRTTAVPLLFAPFSGSLAGQDRAGAVAFTGAGAVRYLPAQGGRVNYLGNPRVAIDTAGYVAVGGTSFSRLTTDGVSAQTCLEATASVLNDGLRRQAALDRVPGALAVTLSFAAKFVAGAADWALVPRDGNAALSAFTVQAAQNFTPTADWQRFTFTWQMIAGMSCPGFEIRRRSSVAATIRVTDIVLEAGPRVGAVTYFDGASPGAAWLDPVTGQPGTAHASPSVSAAAVLVEEATTNAITNPRAETATTGYGASAGGVVVSRDTTYANIGTAALKTVTPGSVLAEGVTFGTAAGDSVAVVNGQTWTFSVWLRGSGAVCLRNVTRTAAFAGLTNDQGPVITLTDQWVRYSKTYTVVDATAAFMQFQVATRDTPAVITFWAANWQAEQKAYATTYCDGALGTGYTWSGAAHASSSSRASAKVSIDETGRIDAARGSLHIWFRRDADAGARQHILNVGDQAAGVDYHYVTVEANDSPFLDWRVNAGGPASLTWASPNTPGVWRAIASNWDGNATGLAVDGSGRLVGVRPGFTTVVTAAAGKDLCVGSANTGVGQIDGPVGPLFVFDRPLTTYERLKLVALGPAAAFDSVKSYPPI